VQSTQDRAHELGLAVAVTVDVVGVCPRELALELRVAQREFGLAARPGTDVLPKCSTSTKDLAQGSQDQPPLGAERRCPPRIVVDDL
jgi:hypothetical protein